LGADRRAGRAYADNDLGGVDASFVAVVERLRIETIATLDRRHFGPAETLDGSRS
jgi:predicted nucleic acid-binding protein